MLLQAQMTNLKSQYLIFLMGQRIRELEEENSVLASGKSPANCCFPRNREITKKLVKLSKLTKYGPFFISTLLYFT